MMRAAVGVIAAIAIAWLDLGLVGHAIPRIRALEPIPQVADHVAFGIIAALALARLDRVRQ